MLLVDELDSRDRIVVVAAPDVLTERIRRRYVGHEVVSKPSYLSGIAELARGRVAAALVVIRALERHADRIVAGFRSAIGNGARVVVCCEPAAEPAARGAVAAGADDYLIFPPTDEELDDGLGLAGPTDLVVPGAVSIEELRGLGETCRDLAAATTTFLNRAAQFLHENLRNTGVQIECGSHRGGAGEPVRDPVWVEFFAHPAGPGGRVLIGPRRKSPFTHTDVEKVRAYTQIISSLIESADRRRDWQRLAMTDDLSGLRNRRFLLAALAHILKRAEAERFNVTLLIFDIDDFKHFNDEFGHSVGDELIRETGQLFSRCCRRDDVVTRLGGDEFAVVFWDAEGPRAVGSRHPSDVLGVLERFRRELGTKDWHTLGPGAQGRLTISGGLAGFPWDGRTSDELLEKADLALRTAKKRGKNRIYLVGQEQDDERPDLATLP